jgi:clan AA aspartic protease (TIGR02281 family)
MGREIGKTGSFYPVIIPFDSIKPGPTVDSRTFKNYYPYKEYLFRKDISGHSHMCSIYLGAPKTPKDYFIFDTCYRFDVSISESNSKYENSGDSVTLPLIKSGSIFYAKVIVNGHSEQYIFDTGASEFALKQSTYNQMVRNGNIQFKDRLPDRIYTLADGSIQKNKRCNIETIYFGNLKVDNVTAYIVPDNEPLLLGKSVMDKFKSWRIDNHSNTLIIYK